MSEQSRQALAAAFCRAAKSSLPRAEGDAFDIVPVTQGTFEARPGETVLVITTSSFSFRLLTMFHFAATPESVAYYGADSADRNVSAAFSERVNLCCGAFNRELSLNFPHLGMSIPYSLEHACLASLPELKPEYLSRYAITVNSSVRLDVTLCMCCSAPVEVVAPAVIAEVATGELELF